MNLEEKITELLANDEFLEKVETTNGIEELQQLFAENDVELTSEEVKQLVYTIANYNKSGEINENELDNVSGGKLSFSFLQKMWKAAKGGWKAGVKFSDWMYKTFGVN